MHTEGEPLYVTEGASDCWSMLSSGHKAIAIPSATLLNRKDIETIRSTLIARRSTLHMYPDQDIPGEKLYLQLTRIATDSGLCLVRHSLPPGLQGLQRPLCASSRDGQVLTVNA